MANRSCTMFELLMWLLVAVVVTGSAATATASARPDSLQFKKLIIQDMLESGKNSIISPLSVEILMAIVSVAAAGRTLAEIQQVFNFGDNQSAIIDYYRETLNDLQKHGSRPGVANGDEHDTDDGDDYGAITRSANRIYIQNGTKLRWQFENIVARNFDVLTEPVRFELAAQTADTINSWVRNYTFGRIDKLVSADEFDKSVRLVLVNALYFKNAWESEFDLSRTQLKPFRNFDGSITNCYMMNNVHYYAYGKNAKLGVEIVKIPYYGNSFEMIVVLPVRNLAQLGPETIVEALETTELSNRYVDLTLPKFRIESTTNLNELLKKFGVREAFTTNANLENLLATTDKTRLKIDKIVQKAFIEVGEKGTEAAAATSLKIVTFSLPARKLPPLTLTLDRPFFFLLREKTEKRDLFYGQLFKAEEDAKK